MSQSWENDDDNNNHNDDDDVDDYMNEVVSYMESARSGRKEKSRAKPLLSTIKKE
jgi:hypothetical protein